MLKIDNLHVSLKEERKEILNGVNLLVETGEIHALMGKNGSGKSTLAQTIMGNPLYDVTQGSIQFNTTDILKLEPNERSNMGIFLSFQHPSEINGLNVASFLRLIYNKSHNQNISPIKFRTLLKEKMEIIGIKQEFLGRYLNDGFSGGEKKRMEMLQMLVLEPKLVILDEVDSGLDVDALKDVGKAVNHLYDQTHCSILLITHYSRILKYIKPQYVHIMSDGMISKTGTKDLAFELEDHWYEKQESK